MMLQCIHLTAQLTQFSLYTNEQMGKGKGKQKGNRGGGAPSRPKTKGKYKEKRFNKETITRDVGVKLAMWVFCCS